MLHEVSAAKFDRFSPDENFRQVYLFSTHHTILDRETKLVLGVRTLDFDLHNWST